MQVNSMLWLLSALLHGFLIFNNWVRANVDLLRMNTALLHASRVGETAIHVGLTVNAGLF